MAILLNVPFVSQLRSHGTTRADPTGCWYASACMIGYYFEVGPRFGIPEIYARNLGNGRIGHYATGSDEARALSPNHHQLLADREGLVPVPHCASQAYNYTLDELEGMLRAQGPIFLYWRKSHGGSTYGHASVIIGIHNSRKHGNHIVFHDPESRPNSKMTIGQLANVRQRWQYALMHRPPNGDAAQHRVAHLKRRYGG